MGAHTGRSQGLSNPLLVTSEPRESCAPLWERVLNEGVEHDAILIHRATDAAACPGPDEHLVEVAICFLAGAAGAQPV